MNFLSEHSEFLEDFYKEKRIELKTVILIDSVQIERIDDGITDLQKKCGLSTITVDCRAMDGRWDSFDLQLFLGIKVDEEDEWLNRLKLGLIFYAKCDNYFFLHEGCGKAIYLWNPELIPVSDKDYLSLKDIFSRVKPE